ncbi:hypothetical protein HOA92_07170 [archaeon]|jgi:hypothetical protein|nr:hypothetical protein [archaeon]MBT6762793.1 hypothetical protein [archaeon]
MTSKSVHQTLIQKYSDLITDPESFFSKVKSELTYNQSLFFLIILTLSATLIKIILTTPLLIKGTASFANVTWAAQLLTLIYYPFYTLFYAIIAALISFVLLFLLRTKGNNFTGNLNILAYTQTIPLAYGIFGTLVVLVTELITGESSNQALLAVFSQGFPSVSVFLAFSVMLTLIVTVVSWFHLIWAMTSGLNTHFDIAKHKGILISIVSLILSFIVLTMISGLITFNI